MIPHRLAFWLVLVLLGFPAASVAAPFPASFKMRFSTKLPMCGLEPSKLHPNLCLIKYRITTGSKECQEFFDQGLGYFYSYVWMEAARSFETAARHDPNCPMAWWALSRALEHYGRGSANAALAALLTSLAPGENVDLHYAIEQGVELGRPSEIVASARKTAEGPVSASVAGNCVEVGRGKLTV